MFLLVYAVVVYVFGLLIPEFIVFSRFDEFSISDVNSSSLCLYLVWASWSVFIWRFYDCAFYPFIPMQI